MTVHEANILAITPPMTMWLGWSWETRTVSDLRVIPPACNTMMLICVKFHKNSISSLVGVALTRYMPSFFSWKYKLNHLPFQILDSDHISSCTSAGSVLQLCKVSQKSNKPFRRSCAYKVHGRTDRVIPIYPRKLCLRGGIIIGLLFHEQLLDKWVGM